MSTSDKPWAADFEIDLETAEKVLKEQFPDLFPGQLELVGRGFDNTVYRLNDWAFRFPRRREGLTLIEHELRFLDTLRGRLSVAIPLPDKKGSPSSLFSYPFMGYRWLPGSALEKCRPSPEQRARLARRLGAFLKQLHALPVPEQLPPDSWRRLDREHRGRRIKEQEPALDTSWLDELPVLSGNLRFVHGDLYCRHLLLDDSNELAAIIDWGDLHRGHPVVDLGMGFALFPPSERELFLQAYGGIPNGWRDWCRLRALSHTLNVREFARDIGDAELLRQAERGLHWLQE